LPSGMNYNENLLSTNACPRIQRYVLLSLFILFSYNFFLTSANSISVSIPMKLKSASTS